MLKEREWAFTMSSDQAFDNYLDNINEDANHVKSDEETHMTCNIKKHFQH